MAEGTRQDYAVAYVLLSLKMEPASVDMLDNDVFHGMVDRPLLRKLIANLEMTGRIKFVGWLYHITDEGKRWLDEFEEGHAL